MERRTSFWRYAFALRGSATPRVLSRVAVFGLWGAFVLAIYKLEPQAAIQLGPLEVAGAVLGLLLVLRTNAGHDRWWEARKLWGGIVNQSRNMTTAALVYGPADLAWRQSFARWAAAFPHVARRSLRGERDMPELVPLIGEREAGRVAAAQHGPLYVARRLSELLREAGDRYGMDRFAFLRIDHERALLIDHIGGCERILKTPLPLAYAIKVRRFIVLYMFLLPFALVDRLGTLTPLVTMFVAYPILSLDQIGVELQNPFSTEHLSHLPLDEISAGIEKNLLSLAETTPAAEATPTPLPASGRRVKEG